jgi:hypothetical protein
MQQMAIDNVERFVAVATKIVVERFVAPATTNKAEAEHEPRPLRQGTLT